jgi:hypothetical protein
MEGMTAAVVASPRPGMSCGLVLADPTFLSPEVQREVHEGGVADQHRLMLTTSLDELMSDARSSTNSAAWAAISTVVSRASADAAVSRSVWRFVSNVSPSWRLPPCG